MCSEATSDAVLPPAELRSGCEDAFGEVAIPLEREISLLNSTGMPELASSPDSRGGLGKQVSPLVRHTLKGGEAANPASGSEWAGPRGRGDQIPWAPLIS